MPCSPVAQEAFGLGARIADSGGLSCGRVLFVTADGCQVIPPVDPRNRREEPAAVAVPFSKYPYL